jgi:hypothetical protein
MNDGQDSFLLMLPMYSYLIEPGPRPGYLREPERGIVFVPLWTDHDLFETYLERSGLAGRVSGLVIGSRAELVTYLRSVPETVEEVVTDPNATAKQVLSAWSIRGLLAQLGSDASPHP